MSEGLGEFAGFAPAATAFLRTLEKHNEKTWFEAHREEYQTLVRGPLAALVEEVDVQLAGFAPEIIGHPKRSLFRVHRDIRFSADKSPYKTQATCWFYHADSARTAGKGTAHGGAGFYFEMGPRSCSIGGGVWMPPPPELRKIREEIDAEPQPLLALLKTPALGRKFGGLAEESMLTRMPRGYAEDHPAAALLRHRSFTVGRSLSSAEYYSRQLPALLAREYAIMLPLVRWLNDALGLRTLARR